MEGQVGKNPNLMKRIVRKINTEAVLQAPNLAKGIDVPHFKTEIGGSPATVAAATFITIGLCSLLCGGGLLAAYLSGR